MNLSLFSESDRMAGIERLTVGMVVLCFAVALLLSRVSAPQLQVLPIAVLLGWTQTGGL